MPFQLKTVSVMMAPPKMVPRPSATTVVVGMSAFRRPCLTSTLRQGSPFALANRMYSELITSSMEARWNRLQAA